MADSEGLEMNSGDYPDVWEQMRNAEQSCDRMEKQLDSIHANLDKMLEDLDQKTVALNHRYGTDLPTTREDDEANKD